MFGIVRLAMVFLLLTKRAISPGTITKVIDQTDLLLSTKVAVHRATQKKLRTFETLRDIRGGSTMPHVRF